jgi:hypothetical protein
MFFLRRGKEGCIVTNHDYIDAAPFAVLAKYDGL